MYRDKLFICRVSDQKDHNNVPYLINLTVVKIFIRAQTF